MWLIIYIIKLSSYWYQVWLIQVIVKYPGHICNDKDREALFNVAYNETDNISSRAILLHNNYLFKRYLPALLYLPSTTPFLRAPARELLVPFFTPLIWCGHGIWTHDLWDALPTELSRRYVTYDMHNMHNKTLFLLVPSMAETSDSGIPWSYMWLIICIIKLSSCWYQVWLRQVIVDYPGHICDLLYTF